MVGNILVGIALRLAGATQTVAGLKEVDIASRRAAISLALAKKEITRLDAAQRRNALTNESLALRQSRIMESTANQARRTRAMIVGAFALGGAAGIVSAIDLAAKFQQAMVSVRIATGASADEMDRFQRLVVSTSGVTAQSSVTIAAELAASAAAGLNNPARLRAAFPQIARAADVMMLGPKHLDPVESATQLAQLSHLFGAYSGRPLHEMIDRAVRLMYTQPESLSHAITQGRLFVGPALRYGVSMQDIFTQFMTMGQTGYLRGRGGSGIARYMEYLMGAESLTSHMSKVRRAAMIDLGVFNARGRNRFIRADGSLDLMGSIRYFAREGDAMTRRGEQGRFTTDLMNAFLAQGGRYIATVTLPQVMAQVRQNQIASDRIARPGAAVETAWSLYMHTLIGAWRLFTTNFQNLAMAVFLPVLPPLTEMFGNLAKVMGGWTNVLMDHPFVSGGLAVAAITAVAAAALYATANLWVFNKAIWATARGAGGAAAGSATGTATGTIIQFLPKLGLISFYLFGIYSSIQLIAQVYKMFTNASFRNNQVRQFWDSPGSAGMHEQFGSYAAYYHAMTGRYYGVPTIGSRGQLNNLIRSGRPTGGQLFDQDILKRGLVHEGFNPIIRSLTTGAPLSDVLEHSSRSSSDRTVEAIHAQTSAIVEALSRIGVTINVPGQPSVHQKLFGPHGPVPSAAGGHGSSAVHSHRTGGNFKP